MKSAHGAREEGVHAIPTNDDLEKGEPIVKAKFKVVKKTEITQKKKVIPHIFVIVTSLIGLLCFILGVYHLLHNNNSVDDSPYMKKDIYNPDYSEESLSASWMMKSSSSRRRRCSDYKYGCCHIYHSCSINDGELESNIIRISPYRILSSDKNESNCPTLFHILTNYNHKQKKQTDCSNSKFGCCEIDYSCDRSIHFIKIFPLSLSEIIEGMKIDKLKKRTMYPLTIPKKDSQGSNCPKVRDIIVNYENEKVHYGGSFIEAVLWILGVCFIIGSIISCCKFIFNK